MNEENKAVVVFSIFGVAIGFLSKFLGSARISFVTALFVMIIIGKIFEKVFKKDSKWWLKNGAPIYLLFWLVFWILFFNL